MSSARASKPRGRRGTRRVGSTDSEQTYFAGAAFGPRDAEAGEKVRAWIQANPVQAVNLAKRHAAAFDRSHRTATAAARGTAKKSSR